MTGVQTCALPISPYGIVDYALTEKGLEKYEVERFGRSEGLCIAWVTASRLADDRVEKIVRDNPGDLVETVGKLAQTLNSEYLRVSYSPLAPERDVRSDGRRPMKR